jgi:probable rRNA maturation factor
MIRVSVACPYEGAAVDRKRMREVAGAVLSGEEINDADIRLAFVDNETSRTLNKRYLQHDEATDVLSFPLGDGGGRLAGELVIDAELAETVAREQGHDTHAELALYVIHGLLHLCGYDDKSPAGAAEMRKRERHYLRQLGLPDIAPADDFV